MNIKSKLFLTITSICIICCLVLFVLGISGVISYLWMLVPICIEGLELIWTALWCLLTIGKIEDDSYN